MLAMTSLDKLQLGAGSPPILGGVPRGRYTRDGYYYTKHFIQRVSTATEIQVFLWLVVAVWTGRVRVWWLLGSLKGPQGGLPMSEVSHSVWAVDSVAFWFQESHLVPCSNRLAFVL